MEWVKSVVITTAVISTLVILAIVIVIPQEPPRVQEEDIGDVNPGMPVIEEAPPVLYWNSLDLQPGESFTFQSTFPQQVGEYSFEVKGVSDDGVTMRVYGELNESFDNTAILDKDSMFIDMMKYDGLEIVGTINFLYLSSEYLSAFSRLNLSVGTNYVANNVGLRLNLTVTGTLSIRGFECYVIEVYKWKYHFFQMCINPDIAFPVRVRHYSLVDDRIDYVISLTDYTAS